MYSWEQWPLLAMVLEARWYALSESRMLLKLTRWEPGCHHARPSLAQRIPENKLNSIISTFSEHV